MTNDDIHAMLLEFLSKYKNGISRTLLTKKMSINGVKVVSYLPILNHMIETKYVTKMIFRNRIGEKTTRVETLYHITIPFIQRRMSFIRTRTKFIITQAMREVHIRHGAAIAKKKNLREMREKSHDGPSRRYADRGVLGREIEAYDRAWRRIIKRDNHQ